MSHRHHYFCDSGFCHALSSLHLWKKLKSMSHSELGVIYLASCFRGIGLSLVGVFLPILLIEVGYHFYTAIAWFIIYFLGIHPAVILGAVLVQRLGVKKLMLIGGSLDALALLTYSFFLERPAVALLPAAIMALGRGMYMAGFHAEFAHAAKGKKVGSQFGVLQFLIFSVSVMGPLIGGVMMDFISPNFVLYFGGALYAFSSFCLLLRSEYVPKARVDFKRVLQLKAFNPLGYIPYGVIYGVAGYMWSLYVYFIVGGKSELGFLNTLVGFVVGIFAIGMGRYSDAHQKSHERMVIKSQYTYSAVGLMKAFTTTPLFAFFSSLFGSIAFVMVDTPINSDFYTAMKKHPKDVLNLIILRECGWILGRVCLLAITLGIGWLFMYALPFIGVSVADIGYGVLAYKYGWIEVSMFSLLFIAGSIAALSFSWAYKK